MRHTGRHLAALLATITVASLGATAAAGPVGQIGARRAAAADAGALDTTRAELRDDITEAAQHFVAAEARARALDEQIAAIDQQIADAETAAARLRAEAIARAVELYMEGDTDLATLFDGTDPVETARRVELADRASSGARDALDRLEAVTEDLDARRAELEAVRAEQADLLDELEEERAALDAELAAVQAAYDAAVAAEARAAQAAREQAGSAGAGAGEQAPAATTPAPDAPAGEPAPAPQVREAPPPPAGVHPHHDDPFLVCTRMRESGGNYAAVSPAGYYGAYQFHPTTWNSTAAHAGRPELIGVLPSTASEYDQDDMAWHLYQWQGKAPWLGRC
jgi:hypothetical protein